MDRPLSVQMPIPMQFWPCCWLKWDSIDSTTNQGCAWGPGGFSGVLSMSPFDSCVSCAIFRTKTLDFRQFPIGNKWLIKP